ncbi:Ig-like domain-containing protein [Paraflavitalea sp. CAU 1676]|uniref:Ig-like domain-containing protein n=1 Tax=Paraflavitalea sp. CAU 1676 TaxID=3032598 RepID=UPI0023D9E3EC|nr:Ig-like domain-containing protein [Paraflavitalea sp. CAU 1676]MDF2191562.1 Ig-like domain-containing protein [Paraflavitalea sp. CAU 1676]
MKFILWALSLLTLSYAEATAQCSTTNIALSKTVLSSSEDVNHYAARVVDGNGSDWWPSGGYSGPADQYLTIDLGQSYPICNVSIDFLDAVHHAASYTIQTSANNSSWTTAVTITGNTTVNISHNISATARYVKLNMTEKPVSWSTYAVSEFKIYTTSSNQSPAVSITSPVTGASFTAGNNITINATATDGDGTVSKVEFYKGTEKLGEDATSPYSYTWSNVTSGSYALTAVATDNSLGTATSAIVNITVSNPAGTAWLYSGNAVTSALTLGTTTNFSMPFITNNIERMRIGANGNVGIGTANINDASFKLFVDGAIRARRLKVDQIIWPDYVFEKDYTLMPLSALSKFIDQHHHLPGVPAAAEVQKKGIDVGNNQAILLQKIEELTLYLIEQNKNFEQQQQELKNSREKIAQLENAIKAIQANQCKK